MITLTCFVSISRKLGEELIIHYNTKDQLLIPKDQQPSTPIKPSVAAPSWFDSKAFVSAFVIFPAIGQWNTAKKSCGLQNYTIFYFFHLEKPGYFRNPSGRKIRET